jgi:hypothetical protein
MLVLPEAPAAGPCELRARRVAAAERIDRLLMEILNPDEIVVFRGFAVNCFGMKSFQELALLTLALPSFEHSIES